MYTEKELYTMLRRIRNVCVSHDDCATCPFREDDSVVPVCRVSRKPTIPADWYIPDEDEISDSVLPFPEPRLDF